VTTVRTTDTATETQFTITYDGPALGSGRMEIRQLAPAMMGMADLVERSAGVLYGPTAGVSIEVAADFKRSSFSFDVVAIVLAVASQVGFDINTLLTLIGIDGGGLIGLLRWRRGRPVASIERVEGDSYQVTTDDGDTIIVNGGTVNLYRNSVVRYALAATVEPLKAEGVEELRLGRGRRAEVVITADEIPYFDAPAEGEEVLQDRVSREFLEIVGLSFNPNNVWRFRMPDGTTFTSPVSHDRVFWRQVEQREIQFADGDVLEVDLHARVTRDASTGDLRADRRIVRVVRLIPAPRQIDLLADESNE
jgi:hypothetical protein